MWDLDKKKYFRLFKKQEEKKTDKKEGQESCVSYNILPEKGAVTVILVRPSDIGISRILQVETFMQNS